MVQDTVVPAGYNARENKEYAFICKESVEVPRMDPGESYMGLSGKVHTARRLLVKESSNTGQGHI